MVSREITRPSVYHNGPRAEITKSRYLTPHRTWYEYKLWYHFAFVPSKSLVWHVGFIQHLVNAGLSPLYFWLWVVSLQQKQVGTKQQGFNNREPFPRWPWSVSTKYENERSIFASRAFAMNYFLLYLSKILKFEAKIFFSFLIFNECRITALASATVVFNGFLVLP